MSNSLQDQLFKAGLITEQQLEKAREPEPRHRPRGKRSPGAAGEKGSQRPSRGGRGGGRHNAGNAAKGASGGEGRSESRRGPKRRRGGKRSAARADAPTTADASSLEVQKLRSDAQRSRELLRDSRLAGESAEARRKRERRLALEAFLDDKRLNDAHAELGFNIARGKRVRRVFVTAEQRERIVAGGLIVAVIGADMHIIEPEARQALAELAPDAYFHVGAATQAEVTPDESGTDTEGGADYAGYEVPDDLVW